MRFTKRSLKISHIKLSVKLTLLTLATAIGLVLLAFYKTNLVVASSQQTCQKTTEQPRDRVWRPQKLRNFNGNLRVRGQIVPRLALKRPNREQCSNWAVLIASAAPAALAKQLSELPSWCVVIVAEHDSHWAQWKNLVLQRKNLDYLSPQQQLRLDYSILRHLPRGHISFKSVGYLYAIENGAQFIWDADNSSVLKDPAVLTRLIALAQGREKVPLADGDHFLWNPYPYFKPVHLTSAQVENDSWPRGFPIEYIKDESTKTGVSKSYTIIRSSIGIYQSLADGEPDVDNVQRLTKDVKMVFTRRNSSVALGSNRYAPFNAQASLWAVASFWGMILPVSASNRVADVWRSYIAERLMADAGLHVAFTSPMVTQNREESLIESDRLSEAAIYSHATGIIKWLSQWQSEEDDMPGRMEKLAIGLYEIGAFSLNDVHLYQAWLDDLEIVGYKPPLHKSQAKRRLVPKANQSKTPRVAVCVSGQLRTLTMKLSDPQHPKKWKGTIFPAEIPWPNMTVAESIRRRMYPQLGSPDVFMYVSTKETAREPKAGDTSVCEALRPSSGRLFCSVPREKELLVSNATAIWDSFELRKRKHGAQGLLQQIYGLYECHRMVVREEVASGKQYDWIVRIRPDQYVDSFPSLERLTKDTEKPTIWFSNRKACCCGNEDKIGIAPARWMREYFDRYLYLQQTDWGAPKTSWKAELFAMMVVGRKSGVTMRPHPGIKVCTVKPRYRNDISQA